MNKRKALKLNVHRMGEDDAAFLDGYLEAYADLPDGAWQAACESAIAECPRFKDKDAYDVWLSWCLRNEE